MKIVAEEWRKVINNSFYQVSNQGRVRSFDRVIIKKNGVRLSCKGKTLTQGLDTSGYPSVGLGVGRKGKARTRTVHQLVAEAWLGLRPDGKEVNHKDGDKRNNTLANLEYVTRSQNVKHAYDAGLKFAARVHGEKHGRSKATEQSIRDAHANVRGGSTVKNEARCIGITTSALSIALRGKTWSYLNLPKLGVLPRGEHPTINLDTKP